MNHNENPDFFPKETDLRVSLYLEMQNLRNQTNLISLLETLSWQVPAIPSSKQRRHSALSEKISHNALPAMTVPCLGIFHFHLSNKYLLNSYSWIYRVPLITDFSSKLYSRIKNK